MSNSEWRSTYQGRYLSGYGSLYLVVDKLAMPTSAGSATLRFDALPWNDDLPLPLTDWTYFAGQGKNETTIHIDHGIATRTESQSHIQISFQFMLIVITFNIFKLAIMTGVLFTNRSRHIITLGDAAASFLERPDHITEKSLPLKTSGHVVYGEQSAKIRVKLPSVGPVLRFYTETLRYPRFVSRSALVRDESYLLLGLS